MRHRRSLAILFGVVCLLSGPDTRAAPWPAQEAPDRGAAEPRVIDVVARRFAFEPSEIQVAVGERVRLLVRTADGLHGIEIKKLNVSKEIPRGTTPIPIDFTASEAGRFPILCSEYCGNGHDDMKGTLVVLARTARAPAAPPESPTP